ncbi:MAG: AAA family ATPase [Candidatus Korobacteraceae bacterium]|jgi:type II secretory pathway predicted ATPase ExeA
MYEKFYGLAQNPFGVGPDPQFYYGTAKHNEALANLTYGIRRRKGFVVLTGEVGTGKTLLLRCLLEALRRSKVTHAFIFNPLLSTNDLLRHVVADFGIKDPKTSRADLLLQLHQFLIEVYRSGSTAALLVDEAHLLSAELLEEIRLLSNIETAQHKLLQILLVGQPELDDILDSPYLRQLKQRVALRCKLEPLDEDDVHGYIERRLQLAGASGSLLEIFPRKTLARIVFYSRGTPRLINNICDAALVNAYALHERSVSPEIIEEVATDLRLGASGASEPHQEAWIKPAATEPNTPVEPEPAPVADVDNVFELEPQIVLEPRSRVVLDPGVVFSQRDDHAPPPQENLGNRKAILDALQQLAKLIDPDSEQTAIKQQHSGSGVRNR